MTDLDFETSALKVILSEPDALPRERSEGGGHTGTYIITFAHVFCTIEQTMQLIR